VRVLAGERLDLRAQAQRGRAIAGGDAVGGRVEQQDHGGIPARRVHAAPAHLARERGALLGVVRAPERDVQRVERLVDRLRVAARARERQRLARHLRRLLGRVEPVEVGGSREEARALQAGFLAEQLEGELDGLAVAVVLRRPLREVAQSDRRLRHLVGEPEAARELERAAERLLAACAVPRQPVRLALREERLEAHARLDAGAVLERDGGLRPVHRRLLERVEPARALGRAHGGREGALRVADGERLVVVVRELGDGGVLVAGRVTLERVGRARVEPRAASVR
jgi:hypothetical protein